MLRLFAYDLLRSTSAGSHGEGKGERILEQMSVACCAPSAEELGVWLEATLTVDKDFKRLIRGRSRKTGESYSVARRRLLERKGATTTMTLEEFRRVGKPDLGFVVYVPEAWREYQPDPSNSPIEVGRFAERGESFLRNCLVFRRGDCEPTSVWIEGGKNRTNLEANGFEGFTMADAELGGHRATRIDCEKGMPFGQWHIRSYLAMEGDTLYGVSTGTTRPLEDGDLLDELVRRFEIVAIT